MQAGEAAGCLEVLAEPHVCCLLPTYLTPGTSGATQCSSACSFALFSRAEEICKQKYPEVLFNGA